MPRAVLVLGGSGFIGANVVRALLARGDRVRVLSRSPGPAPALEGCDVERVLGDLRDAAALDRALAGMDALVHCAGAYPRSGRRAARQAAAAASAMRTVLDAAARSGVERVVYTSSYVTVGCPRGGAAAVAADESGRLLPGEGGHAYFDVKRAMEEEVERAAARGLAVILLLPVACFGPYDAGPTTGTAFVTTRRLRPAVYFRGRTNVVDVRDVADAHVAALDRGRTGERYLLGRGMLDMRDLAGLVSRAVGVRPPRWGLPTGPALAVGRALEVIGRAPPFITGTLALLRHACPLDFSKAARELGPARRPIESAIHDEAEWLASHGYL